MVLWNSHPPGFLQRGGHVYHKSFVVLTMADPGRSWQTMAGHGKSWQTMADHGGARPNKLENARTSQNKPKEARTSQNRSETIPGVDFLHPGLLF